MLCFVISKCLSQHPDVSREVCFFNKSVSPNPFHQLIFFYQVTAAGNQHEKGFEYLRSQRYQLIAVSQNLVCHVESEIAEFIQTIELLAHRVSEKFWRSLGEFFKD